MTLRDRVLASLCGEVDRAACLVYADQLEEAGDPRCEFWRLVGKGHLWPLCVGLSVKWWWDKNPNGELRKPWYLPGFAAARLNKRARVHHKTWHGGARWVFYFSGKNRYKNALLAAELAWAWKGE